MCCENYRGQRPTLHRLENTMILLGEAEMRRISAEQPTKGKLNKRKKDVDRKDRNKPRTKNFGGSSSPKKERDRKKRQNMCRENEPVKKLISKWRSGEWSRRHKGEGGEVREQ